MSEEDDALVLTTGAMDVHGRFANASNLTLLVTCTMDGRSVRAVFKPQAGLRPLHDFDVRTLGLREVAAYQLSAAAGWDAVPLTVWREDSPAGPGAAQVFVDDASQSSSQSPDAELVDVLPSGQAHGMLTAFTGEDEDGDDVDLVHADDPGLRMLALFDAVINNADRKAGHLLRSARGIIGIDHGLAFHHEPKLRTVLWGWAGQPLTDQERQQLEHTAEVVHSHPDWTAAFTWASAAERQALAERIATLLRVGAFPEPDPSRRCIPWPVF